MALIIIILLIAAIAGGFGTGGMGRMRQWLQAFCFVFFLYGEWLAFHHYGWVGPLAALACFWIVFGIVSKLVNDKYHGFEYDRMLDENYKARRRADKLRKGKL